MKNSVIFPTDVDTKKYMLAMKILDKKAFPQSVANTLNNTADAVTKQQIKNVKRDLRVRTKYTINSMQKKGHAINHARGQDINRMFSRAGTFSKYLWMQEDDFTKKGMDGPVPIPTLATRISKNIGKSVRKKYRLSPGQSLSDSNLDNNTFIGKPKGRPRGMYQKGKKNTLILLRNLEHDQVKIKGTHFHSDSVKKYGTQQFIAAQYKKEFMRMRKKRGVA